MLAGDGVATAFLDFAGDGVATASLDFAGDGVATAFLDFAGDGVATAEDGGATASLDFAGDGAATASLDFAWDGAALASPDSWVTGHGFLLCSATAWSGRGEASLVVGAGEVTPGAPFLDPLSGVRVGEARRWRALMKSSSSTAA